MKKKVMIVFELGVLMGPILESILLELASEVSSDLSDTDYRFTIHMTTAFAVACSVAPFFFLLASILALFVPKVYFRFHFKMITVISPRFGKRITTFELF